MKKITLRNLTQGGVIAALYAALTLAPALIPGLGFLSFGIFQIRISEALTILPIFTGSAVWGLFVGCGLANLLGLSISGLNMIDVVLGSLATLIAAYFTRKLKHNRYLAIIPPIIFNAVIVGTYLPFLYFKGTPIAVSIALVGLGEAVVCYGLGIPLSFLLDKYRGKVFEK